MSIGKLIRIFLVEGDPDGIITAEIQNMTIYTTYFPRTKIRSFKNRNEASKPGIYFLIGDNIENPFKPIVYVGEGSPVIDRILSHDKDKDNKKEFWDKCIVFSSKDDYLTKTQIQYLESKAVTDTHNIQGAELNNIQQPKEPVISEVDRAEMEEFYINIKLLLKTFGYGFLDEKAIEIETYFKNRDIVEINEESKEFSFNIKGAEAKMKIIDNKYIVLKGSTIVKEKRKHIPVTVEDARNTLKKQGKLIEIDSNLLELTVDYIWTSPSYASAFVAGGNDNGRTSWKYKGKTLAEVEKEEVK